MNPKYLTQASRAATFRPPRRRSSVSNESTAKPITLKWPHSKTLKPQTLARAGFYYDPVEDSVDNVTCYLCGKSLDGWEESDDPLEEHLRHSDDCGWAIAVSIEDWERWDGHTPDSLAEARLMTFGKGVWPLSNNRNLSVERMVDAGFYYAPLGNTCDHCFCPFCGTNLSDWDPEDDPFNEHQRRQPNCAFFSLRFRNENRSSSAESVSDEMVISENESEIYDRPSRKTKGNKALISKAKGTAKKGGRTNTVLSPEISVDEMLDEPIQSPLKPRRKRSINFISKEPVILYDGRADSDLDDSQESSKKQKTSKNDVVHQSQHNGHGISLPDNETLKPKFKRRITSGRNKPRPIIVTEQDFDEALELGLEGFQSDEDQQSHPQPFIRTVQRANRSRTSLMVEKQMRDTPSDSLIPTTARGKGRHPPIDVGRMPIFGVSGQGLMPIEIPKHLNDDRTSEFLDGVLLDEDPERIMDPTQKKRGRPRRVPAVAEKPITLPKRTKAVKRKGKQKQENPKIVDPLEFLSDDPLKELQASIKKRKDSQSISPQKFKMDIVSLTPTIPDEILNKHIRSQPVLLRKAEAIPLEEIINDDTVSESGSVVHHDVSQSSDAPADVEAAYDVRRQCIRSPLQKDLLDVVHHQLQSPVTSDNISYDTSEVQPIRGTRSSTRRRLTNQHDFANDEMAVTTADQTLPNSEDPQHSVSQALVSPPAAHSRQIQLSIHSRLQSTPNKKSPHKLVDTSALWIPIDLDTVFDAAVVEKELNLDFGSELTAAEREMTIEEWIKWSAAKRERSFNRVAERMIALFEEHGRKAALSIQGIIAD